MPLTLGPIGELGFHLEVNFEGLVSIQFGVDERRGEVEMR